MVLKTDFEIYLPNNHTSGIVIIAFTYLTIGTSVSGQAVARVHIYLRRRAPCTVVTWRTCTLVNVYKTKLSLRILCNLTLISYCSIIKLTLELNVEDEYDVSIRQLRTCSRTRVTCVASYFGGIIAEITRDTST